MRVQSKKHKTFVKNGGFMKKKILLILACALLFPTVAMLTACGGGE